MVEELYASLAFPSIDLLHSGDILPGFFPSALRGCSLSGERARRSNGDPAELGSDDLGREKDFLLGVILRLLPGENVWVAWLEPG